MKLPLALLAFVSLCGALVAEPIEISGTPQQAAIKLHSKIPAWSLDHLFEAKKTKDWGWQYSFITDYRKSWVEEVRITVRHAKQRPTTIEVEAVRLEYGTFSHSTIRQPDRTKEWSAKIAEFMQGTMPVKE